MKYKGGYDRQSVQSAAGKLSCNKTALLLLLLLLQMTNLTCR